MSSCSRSSTSRARSSAARPPRSSSSTARRTSSCSRPSPARARKASWARASPSSTGIAGFALFTRQPIVVDDLASDPRFSQERAETTGYVPSSIVASPLLHGERALGVLSVLDRAADRPFGLSELELLSRFSTQAAIGLDLLLRARGARAAIAGDGTGGLVARVAALLEEADDDAGRRLLEALEQVLAGRTAKA
ncbi:MAG: GAF domain-containing protein [Gaiella sp.]|nr:GAF domain-containing protein [Gaiella sp.]